MSSNVILREAMDFLNELESLRAEVAARDAYFKKIKKSKDKEEMARYQKMADDKDLLSIAEEGMAAYLTQLNEEEK